MKTLTIFSLGNQQEAVSTVKLVMLLSVGMLLINSEGAWAQNYKWRAKGASFRLYNETYSYWEDWSAWKDVNMLIVLKSEEQQLILFAKEKLTYDIIRVNEVEYDKDGDPNLILTGVDDDGQVATIVYIRLVSRHENRSQLYIKYKNAQIAYELTEIGN